ncbi:farnesyl-diphosphate synthase [Candidatus Koribacter versatilis Ellin345]|uniref:Farnesyl-diphosphate synthase n=2 Tax=Candidatus Korobacter versatilis TaxID=658062 RepID=Q1IL17_KORVE|nr:farnesyl-diphosphate synthase [Candidatus Koribacter versatilis Ellin345]
MAQTYACTQARFSVSDCYTSCFMLKETLEQGRILADAALERLLPPGTQRPPSIHQAMRHSVFAGGKRLRPILVMEAARMITGSLPDGVDELGAALEMLHTYSLIHDDLPALDNDDLRRGRPTCHVAFGEATAILAGDALQTYAYEVMARLRTTAEARVQIIEEVAHATGTIDGMIGGQVLDLEAEHTHADAATVEYIHRSKTGALITASVVAGGLYAGADKAQVQRIREFGKSAGLAFQIVDDVLDVTQTSEQLGKTAGKDTKSEKSTWPSLYGVDKSLEMADELVYTANKRLDSFGERATTLKELAKFLVERKK